MKLRLLGTGGADGIPGLFSGSRVSEYARLHGGKDVRTRSAALVDSGLKLDLPPDTFSQLARDGLAATDWTAIVFTHGDDDHLEPAQLQYALYPFTDADSLEPTVYGNARVLGRVRDRYPEWPIELKLTRSFECFMHLDYSITPARANHNADEDSQNLLIERDGKALLYATDTGFWPQETWEFLAGQRLDALVLECTNGFVPSTYAGHLDLRGCFEVVERLRRIGALDDASRVLTTHHSHLGNGTYHELAAACAAHGIIVGYDGLVVDL